MAKPAAKTLANFRSLHDRSVVVPEKIRAALAQMEAEGAENWEYELDFMRRAGVNNTDIGQFRELFAEHIVETSHVRGRSARRVWFAKKAVAAKARGE